MSRSSSPYAARRRPPPAPAGWPPRWLTPAPEADLERGDGDHAVRWMETFCRATKDSVAARAGELLRFRHWQRELTRHLLARRPDGLLLYRTALVGVARKNTKSTLGSALGLYGLLSDYPDGPQGREVYSCAGDRDQAKIVFGTARRMLEMEPELLAVTRLYRDAIEVPATGSVYRALSAEAYTKEGLSPTLVLFDEVHVQPDRELWDVMALATGARTEPLMVGITTAGVRFDSQGEDSLAYQLYQHGVAVASGELDDPTFFFAWWEPADPDADHEDPATWAEANPGLGDLVSLEDFESAVRRTPENEFRTKRCNQWVASSQAWLPSGAWQACARPGGGPPPDGARVVLGFDGSYSQDSSALVVAEVPARDRPGRSHLDLVGLWERPPENEDPAWTVDVLAVEETIRQACRRWRVAEVAADPYRWARSLQVLAAEGLPTLDFPQSPQRMTPATQRFYEAVVNRTLTHSGNPRLARHLANAVLKTDARGSRIVKEHRHSRRRIDAAVAALMAYDRACWHAGQRPATFFGGWR